MGDGCCAPVMRGDRLLERRTRRSAQKVSCVVIESTSDCWRPFYYLLDDGLNVVLVNAASVRNLPGRKTDVSDAAWLADLGAPGCNESAGKVKSTKTRHGNRYLKGALGIAALAASRSKGTYLSVKIPAYCRPPRPDESPRRRRTHHAHRRLEHAAQR